MSNGRWFRADGQAWHPFLYEWWFRRTAIGRRFRRLEEEAVADAVRTVLKPEHDVLEVGSGTGHYTCLLDELGARVVARDASEPMVRYLRRRLGPQSQVDAGLGRLPGDLDVTGPFDGIVAIGVLNYVEDLGSCLHAFADLLEPAGWAVFSVPPADHNGRRYRQLERLGRRLVHLRSAHEVRTAASEAGLHIEAGPTIANVMAVYRCGRR